MGEGKMGAQFREERKGEERGMGDAKTNSEDQSAPVDEMDGLLMFEDCPEDVGLWIQLMWISSRRLKRERGERGNER